MSARDDYQVLAVQSDTRLTSYPIDSAEAERALAEIDRLRAENASLRRAARRVDYRKLLWKYMRGVIECEGVAHIGSDEEWEPAEWAELQAIYDMPFEYLPPKGAL